MKTRFTALAVVATALMLASGCQTVESRIQEKPGVFAKLDPATQAKIKQGVIDLGFTEEMVYLALGAPDRKRETISTQGRSVTWIYNSYDEYYDDSHFLGYYGGFYRGPFVNSYRLAYRHPFTDVYVTAPEERVRVVFKDGKAAVIEMAKS